MPRVLESFQVEDGHGVRSPVTRETAAEVRGDGNAMHTLGIGDLPGHSTAVGVEYHDAAPVRHVDAPRIAVNRDVIPTLISSHGDGLG